MMASTDARLGDSKARAERALSAIVRKLNLLPIEDGVTHDAESDLSDYISNCEQDELLGFAFDSEVDTAARLRLLGRCRLSDLSEGLCRQLVAKGLAHESLDVRDAVIQAAENWGASAFVDLLKSHIDSVEWLGRYAASIASEVGQ